MTQIIVRANTWQQYDKWQEYLAGKYNEVHMHIIATTYYSEMVRLFGYKEVQNSSEKELFTEFAYNIKPPLYERVIGR